MLNKLELRGDETSLFTVTILRENRPQGSYVYKTLQSALDRFEQTVHLCDDVHSVAVLEAALTWTELKRQDAP